MTTEEKVKKWDALGEAIAENYVNPKTGELWTDAEAEERGFDLISIGESAASAFGWI